MHVPVQRTCLQNHPLLTRTRTVIFHASIVCACARSDGIQRVLSIIVTIRSRGCPLVVTHTFLSGFRCILIRHPPAQVDCTRQLPRDGAMSG
jgi:hypothetical protein